MRILRHHGRILKHRHKLMHHHKHHKVVAGSGVHNISELKHALSGLVLHKPAKKRHFVRL